ncbi:hypothetical protein [Streptomyces sp. NPDC007083]|uniref:hypothetical protein n=1 Tax=Streptomyces sp. NPDC007083 TaxID=3156913 RepID=UPI0033D701AC
MWLWNRPYSPPVSHPSEYPRLICKDTLDPKDWDHLFPRFYIRYGGVSCHRSMTRETRNVPYRELAEQQATLLHFENRPGYGFHDFWCEVKDEGSAPYPEFGQGAVFWATGGSNAGKKGHIVIRHRYSAAVQWDGAHFVDSNSFPFDLMSTTPYEPHHIRHSMDWLKG